MTAFNDIQCQGNDIWNLVTSVADDIKNWASLFTSFREVETLVENWCLLHCKHVNSVIVTDTLFYKNLAPYVISVINIDIWFSHLFRKYKHQEKAV